MGCIRGDSEEEYRSLVRDLSSGATQTTCSSTPRKTKEVGIDYGKFRLQRRPVQIEGAVVENVVSYKNLGLWLDNKLSWASNTDHLYRKA